MYSGAPGTFSFSTLIVIFAVTSAFAFAVTVIVTSPALTPFTTPSASTVAIASLLDLNSTSLLVASSGVTSTVRETVLPTRTFVSPVTLMLVGKTS